MIAIVDYGVGNLFSLSSSLKALGLETEVTRDAEKLRSAGPSGEKRQWAGIRQTRRHLAFRGMVSSPRIISFREFYWCSL